MKLNISKLNRKDFACVMAEAAIEYPSVMNSAIVEYDQYQNDFCWGSSLTPSSYVLVQNDVQAGYFGGGNEAELTEYFSDESHPQANEVWDQVVNAISEAFDLADDQDEWGIVEDE